MFCKKKVLCFIGYFVIFFFLLNEWHIIDAARTDRNSTNSDEQRKVIAIKGFNKEDDGAILAAKGIIVQPSWTQNSKETNENVKVEVTADALNEVNALRAEINRAVAQDSYVGNAQSSDAQQAKKLNEMYSATSKASQPVNQDEDELVTSEIVGNKKSQTTTDENAHEMLGGGADEEEKSLIPNVVEANAFTEPSDIDLRKLQKLEYSKRREREVLILSSIVENYNFNLGEDVMEWEHIVHGGEEYFIGRRQIDLIVVRKNAAQYESASVIEIGQPITYLETYFFWNFEQRQQEGIILIATGDRVLWYRVHNETGRFELNWEWKVGRAISGLTYFASESNEYLAVSTNESSLMGYYALNIYQFEFHAKEFWIAQQMQLPHACSEVTILDTGRDIILAVAQNNTAFIYTFNPHEDASDHIRFKLLRTIDSEGIELITGFEMGGRSYLALGGYQPQILLYQNGDFTSKTILGSNFGLVEFFFPVPAHTYRDDLILLVQHRVDFGTHDIVVLETLIWDGDAFEASIPVPCYFGEHLVYGVSCMLDIQCDEGLKGAALLRNGNEISIIVPRHNAESGLFRLNIELLAKNSEFVDLQDIFAFLKDWVKEQDDLIAQAQEFININDAIELQQKAQTNVDLTQLVELETPEFAFYGQIEEIYVNDHQWREADTKTDLKAIMHSIEGLANSLDSGRQRRDVSGGKPFTLNYLDVEEAFVNDLQVENVNNAPFYIQNGTLDFNGILDVKNLEVLDKLHARKSRQAAEERLEINGHLQFIEINGIPWEELKNQFVFQNEPINLENLEVVGDIVFENQLNITLLNSLRFPEDYLLSSGPTTSTIEAEKIFLGNLEAIAMDTDGWINGVNPLNAITLNGEQEWKAMLTFSNLEVSEKFDLNGIVIGADAKNIPKNPTLQEATSISAICNFKTLIVNGPVFLNGSATFADASLLNDIVQRPANPIDEIAIPSQKIFEKIEFPVDLNVASNAINNITIDQFVTLHTAQDLDIDTIEGFVYFNDLNITGLYDGVDIEELEKNSIKIDEPQISLNTQLNFVDIVNAANMNVHANLNGKPIGDYQTINEDLVMPNAEFQILKSKVAEVTKNITGNATLNGLNLNEFLDRRSAANATAAANVGNIFLDELILEDTLEADIIYGIETKHLWNFLAQTDELPEMILDGKVQVDHIIVTGDVQLSKLNGQHFDDEIQRTAIWLNRTNFLNNNLTFLEPIILNNDLAVLGDYNDVKNLPALIDDMIFHLPNHSILITAPKSFSNDLHVVQNMQINSINGVPFNAIATKSNDNNFKGNLQIRGRLITKELEIGENLGTFTLANLKRLMRYDVDLNAFVLLGNTTIMAPQQLDDLTVNGNLNEIANLNKFFEHLLYKDNNCVLTGNTTFTGRVTIENGAQVQNFNGNNLMELLNNIVLINELESVAVKSTVIFKTPIQANNVRVINSLNTTNINGCSIDEWLRETIRVDQPRNFSHHVDFAANSLNGNSLHVNYINGVDLSELVTLHTEQNITASNLNFSTIYLNSEMETTGLVNDVNLREAYENTLLSYGNQHVSTPLTFNSLMVLRDLQTNAPVNTEQDLTQVATLNEENLIIESPIFFQNILAHNVYTNDTVSGINFTQWFDETLWLRNRPNQLITGNWQVRNLIVKPVATNENAATAFGAEMSDNNANEHFRKIRDSRNYENLCQKLKKLSAEQNKRLLYIRHLEKSFEFDLKTLTNETIRKSFILHINDDEYDDYDDDDDRNDVNVKSRDYLLLNTGCVTYVYKWKPTKLSYVYLNNFISGPIDEAATVITNELKNNKTINFLTYSMKQNCTTKIVGGDGGGDGGGVGVGLTLWQLQSKNNEVKILKNFAETTATANEIKFCGEGEGASGVGVGGNEIYTINQNELKQISLYENNGKLVKLWKLPNVTNDTTDENYHFIKQFAADAKTVILSNGRQILQLNNSTKTTITSAAAAAENSTFVAPLTKFQQQEIAVLPNLQITESVLKPNATKRPELTFAEFRQSMERILSELIYRMQLEIDVTQLSIPESDLFDEHLIEDFIAIMQEIHKQEIFVKETFAIFSDAAITNATTTAKLEMPENVAQVLAARIVQIIWPTIVEVKEVHSYLRENVTKEHAICACIMKSLGTMVRDVLILSNMYAVGDDAKNVKQDHEQQLITVIERIREFQNDLEYFIAQLNADIKAELQFHTTPTTTTTTKTIATTTNEKIVGININSNETTFYDFKVYDLPEHNANEILHFHVGNQQQPLVLYAIVNKANARNAHANVAAAAEQLDSIKLYMNFLTGPLFQTINAHRPHALITMRMRDETLLAFIEECCTLHILIYRGVQGFIDFVKFKINEKIQQLHAVKLLNADRNNVYYFVIVTQNKIKFYQVVVAGRDYALPANLKCKSLVQVKN